ncbi:hypothetical protein Emed_005889 [Eimeria media]
MVYPVSAAAAAAAAAERLQQQIAALEGCLRSVRRLKAYLQGVTTGACKPQPALLREAMGLCKRLCRAETAGGAAATAADAAAAATAAAAAVAAAAASDCAADIAAADNHSSSCSSSSNSNEEESSMQSTAAATQALQQLLQQLLPSSRWGETQQQQQQQQQQLPSQAVETPGVLQQQETELALTAVLGDVTMGLAAAHAAVCEQRGAARALGAMQEVLDIQEDA